MANYNFAQGGDTHYNENYALYPQNALVEGRPEFGSSKSLLKPAHHWEGGSYAAVRHISINDRCTDIGMYEAAATLAEDDTFITHIVPSMSLLTGFHYVIHTPLAGASITVQTATDATEIGVIDGSVAGDGWFEITPTYIPSTTNEAIEFVLTGWPAPEEEEESEDPCGVFNNCVVRPDFCFTGTVFYQNARAETYCEAFCYDNCDC